MGLCHAAFSVLFRATSAQSIQVLIQSEGSAKLPPGRNAESPRPGMKTLKTIERVTVKVTLTASFFLNGN